MLQSPSIRPAAAVAQRNAGRTKGRRNSVMTLFAAAKSKFTEYSNKRSQVQEAESCDTPKQNQLLPTRTRLKLKGVSACRVRPLTLCHERFFTRL